MHDTIQSIVIFTDLDGTLLNSKYSFQAALPAIHYLKEHNIPLILCSSKTCPELQLYRRRIGNIDPFITENGGGIYIPRGYFRTDIAELDRMAIEEMQDYKLLRLGARYEDLRALVRTMIMEGYSIKGFGDMTVADIVKSTGLPAGEAGLAKNREFDEPIILGAHCDIERVHRRVKKAGFRIQKGRFYHIVGDSDKGKAVAVLIDLYQKEIGNVITVAVGDGLNDASMLACVDHPIIVMKEDGTYDSALDLHGMTRADGIGPVGWNKAILRLLSEI